MVIEETSYVEKAEKVIERLRNNKDKYGNVRPVAITTSKIRNLLAMSADIYNEVLISGEKLSDELNARIDYLRIRFVYEAGRDPAVKKFIEFGEILQALQEIKGSRKQFILFNHYIEALVAYHRFYEGKD